MTPEDKERKIKARMEAGARLRKFRESTGLNRIKFAGSIGVPVDTQRTYESGTSEPGSFYFKKLKEKYPEADIGFIFTGQPSNPPQAEEKKSELQVRVIPVVASIPPEGIKTEVPQELIIEWIPTTNMSEPVIFALIVRGNLFAPEAKAGDYVVLAPTEKIVPGQMYAVYRVSNKIPIMREVYETDTGYTLISEDPHTEPITIGRNELKAVYKCLNIFRPL